jgi:hypothetical protein
MDFITEDSPSCLIAADMVYEIAETTFGTKYDYHITTGESFNIESIVKNDRPELHILIESEASELTSKHDMQDIVLLSGIIIAPVKSSNIAHIHDHLQTIDKLKHLFLGHTYEHKNRIVNGGTTLKETPSFADWHEVGTEFGGTVLRAYFDMIFLMPSKL